MKKLFIFCFLVFNVIATSAQEETFDYEPPYTQDEIVAMEAEGLEYTDYPSLTAPELETLQAITPQAAPSGTGLLYWADQLDDSVGTVTLDGSTLDVLVTSAVPGADNIRGIAIDPLGDASGPKVYWASSGNAPEGVFRMNLDGTNVEQIITLTGAWAIEIDFANDLLYVSDIDDNSIYQTDLYGTAIGSGDSINSSLQAIFTGIEADFVEDIELDVPNNTIYWTTFSGNEGVYRATLGTPLTGVTNICTPIGLSGLRYFYRDVVNDTIFLSNGAGLFRTADINCTGNTVTNIIPSVSGRGIQINPQNGLGYFTESTNDALWQFDPTEALTPSILRTDTTNWSTPQGLALLQNDTAPTVTTVIPADSAIDVSLNSVIAVTFDEPVDLQASSLTLECPNGTSIDFAVSPSTTSDSFTLTPNTDLPAGTTCTLTIPAASVNDADTVDGPDAMATDFVSSFTTIDLPEPTPTNTPEPTTVSSGSPGPSQPQATAIPLEDLGVVELPATGQTPLWAQLLRMLLGLND